MATPHVRARADSKAPAEAVWRLLTDVRLSEQDGGTHIEWVSEFTSKWPR